MTYDSVTVIVSDNDFSYDIHSLTSAFFPFAHVRIALRDSYLAAENEETFTVNVSYLSMDGIYVVKAFAEDVPALTFIENEEITVDQNGVFHVNGVFGGRIIDDGIRLTYKNIIKQVLFCFLQFHTGRKLPWGSLTGIRPTKLARKLILASDYMNAVAGLKDTYYVSGDKARLACDVALTEHNIIRQFDKNGYSLYVSIPFCKSICNYCSFGSQILPHDEKVIDDYIDCLETELKCVARLFKDRPLLCVYIGGGTPSVLPVIWLERIFAAIRDIVGTKDVLEETFEAGRPDTITKEKLILAKSYGYTRISVNPQSMNDETLRRIGRGHTVSDVIKAYDIARACNVHINMDMIIGLQGERGRHVRESIKAIMDLAPDSVTLHTLSIKRGSKLKEEIIDSRSQISDYYLAHHDAIHEVMRRSYDSLYDVGYLPYYLYRQKNTLGNLENIGFCKPNCEGLYNIIQMQDTHSIAAIGAGAISKCADEAGQTRRAENSKDLRSYMTRIEEMCERKIRLFCG